MNLLTVEEVAEWLQVPKSWIYDRTRSGAIPCVKIGKYVRFNKDEIEAWLNDNRQTPLSALE